MNKTKNKKARPFLLIELLNTFSKRELEHFSSFVNCTYFNTDKYAMALLDVLIKQVIHQTDFDQAVQCIVFKSIFPEKAAPKSALDIQQKSLLLAKMNLLMRLAEQFLCNESLKNNAACRTELLYAQLLERNQFFLFNRQLTKDEKTLDEQPAKGVDQYAHQFRMELGRLNYLHQRGYILKEDNLPELIESLDVFYLLNKLNLHTTCITMTRAIAKKKYDYEPMKIAEQLMDLPQYTKYPLIRIHHRAIELLNTNKLKDYQELLQLLDQYSETIPVVDLNNFYKIAINFCSQKIVEGHSDFYQHAFDLYRIMDNKNLLLERNFMPAAKLKNIITLCCRLGQFEWAMDTIEKYRPHLEKKYADSIYHFNMGAVAFYQNNFKTALSHFIRVEKVNITYNINSRAMLLKSHYELDTEYDERTMRTFLMAERFVKTNKSLRFEDKRAYRNFIRLLMNLYRVRHRASRVTPERLMEKLNNYDLISDKRWLADKIGDLK